MFTVELKASGSLIGVMFVNRVNHRELASDQGKISYRVEYHRQGEETLCSDVLHKTSLPIEYLVLDALNELLE